MYVCYHFFLRLLFSVSTDISTLQPKHHKHNIMKLFFLLAFFFAFLTTAIAAEEDVTLETAAELPIDLEKHDLDILEEAVEPTLEDRRLGYYNCKYVGPTYEGGKCLKIKYCLNSWAGKWYKVKAKSLPWADCWKKNGHKKNDSSSSSSSSDKDCKKWKRKYKDCKKKHSKSKVR